MEVAASTSGRLASHGVHLTLSEQTALNRIRCIVDECSNTVSASALARELALRGLMVTLRTSLPKGFHSLKHRYLIAQTHVGGAAIIVDVEFRDRFHYTGLPAGAYAACVAALPQLLVATMATVTTIAHTMSDALEREAAAQHHDLPPWRSRRALFANWLPERFTDDVFAPPGATIHPVLLHTRHCQPAFQCQPPGPALLPVPFPSWTSPDEPAAACAGEQQDSGSGSSGCSSGCPFKTHPGSKRKAEAAAGGDSSPAKAPGPKPRSPPQPAQNLCVALQQLTESSTGWCAGTSNAASTRNAGPPCVITGFSAPSSRTTAALGRAISRCSSSGSGSSSSSDCVMADEGGSGAEGTPYDNPMQRRSSSGGSSNGCGRLDSPFLAAQLPTDAAAYAAADGKPVTHGTAAAPLERRVSGLTRKLQESGAAAAAAATGVECTRSRSGSRDFPRPFATDGRPVLQPGSEPNRNTVAVAAVAAGAAGVGTDDGLDGAGTAAPSAAAGLMRCAGSRSIQAPPAAAQPWHPPLEPLPPQPVVGCHLAGAPSVAAAAAGAAGAGCRAAAVGGGGAGLATWTVDHESPPPAVRLLRCKGAEVLPRIFKVRPRGWAGVIKV